ncbi:MAG: methyltransferase [Nanoarchaeota archaeon]|nr:methyltransferase [Nanoarchaeota archaeon]
MPITKTKLKIQLSKLGEFKQPKLNLEQYPTPGNIAATILWNAFMLGDIEDKIILDAGCGTGRFGIGALLLGAKFVYFVDIDKKALTILKENLKQHKFKNYQIINKDIKSIKKTDFKKKLQTIIQNPPFGTKKEHADKLFLEKAFKLCDRIYSMHKLTTKAFLNAIVKDSKFKVTHYWDFFFELKQTQAFHKRKIYRIDVACWRLKKTRF